MHIFIICVHFNIIQQSMIKIAILASGSGSNAENIAKYFAKNDKIKIDTIVSNRQDAFVHQRAKSLGIDSFFLSKSDFSDSAKINNILSERNIDFIVLAGFLLKIPQKLIELYPDKIINIHPALLPKYGGKGMYGDNVHKAVVDAKEEESGITIHYVNENYDEGNIIFQAKCKISENDTFEDVANKVHKLEYDYFPMVIENVIQKTFFDK